MSAEAIKHLTKADKVLGRLIKKVGPCGWKPERRRSPFESLVQAVTHQQLNGIAAKTILGRMKALYPERAFPSPEDLLGTPDEKLRAAGLSRAKIASIKDIAAKTLEGIVPTSRAIARMDNDTIITQLTGIRGVGPWTVEMLLMFKLGRTDVLPATDFGVRKGFALIYELEDLPAPKDLLEHGERWRPYRSFAAWYLWRALD
jgi:DNA-3-methyladenine glycosylase II